MLVVVLDELNNTEYDPPAAGVNPLTPAEYKDLEKLGKVDLILVTHGHFDHIADAPALAMLHKARVFSPGDLNQTLTVLKVLPPELAPRMNKSGSVTPFADAPKIKITAVRAEHSSAYVWRNPASNADEVHVGGEPVGFIIELEDGQKIYHMGDTGLFGDMKFIGEYYKPAWNTTRTRRASSSPPARTPRPRKRKD